MSNKRHHRNKGSEPKFIRQHWRAIMLLSFTLLMGILGGILQHYDIQETAWYYQTGSWAFMLAAGGLGLNQKIKGGSRG